MNKYTKNIKVGEVSVIGSLNTFDTVFNFVYIRNIRKISEIVVCNV